jgi:hypothetical protein
MAWLRRSVNDKRRPNTVNQRTYGFPVTHVDFMMLKRLVGRHKPLLISPGIALGSEEVRSHIVIDAMNSPTALTKEINYL